MKKLTIEELQDIAALIIKGDLVELRKILKDPTQTVIRLMIASVAVRSIERGDMSAIDKLLDRLLGKVKTQIDHSGIPSGTSNTVIIGLPDNERD